MCDEEARVVQMRPVEKAALDLSGPVVDSVSSVLGVDAVVLSDGGGSSGFVGVGMCLLEMTWCCVVLTPRSIHTSV